MKEKKSVLILMMVALCVSCLSAMGDMIITPIANYLYEIYSQAAVSYMLTGPALIIAIVSIFAGKLIEKFGAKRTLIADWTIYTIGALMTVFIQTEPVLVIGRTLQGLGLGAYAVCAVVIITEHFADEKQRGAMMGIYNSAQGLAGAALSIVAGIVASTGWQNAFLLFLISIPTFILLLLFVPKDKTAQPAEGANTAAEKSGAKTPMPWGISIRVALSFLVFNIIYAVVLYQIAVVMGDKGFTDTALIGTMSSLSTIGGFLTSVAFGIYFPKLKRFCATACYGLLVISYTMIYFSATIIPLGIGITIAGLAYGIGISYYLTYCTMVVPLEHVPMSTSLTMFAMGFGTFLASYVPYALMAIMGTDSITDTILPMIVMLVVGTVLTVFFGIKEKSYFANM